MSLIMPNGGRTVNWGLPGAQPQMPLTRGPEQLAWQQQNRPEPAPKPAGNFSSYRPGQAQSQQSPYADATSYKPQNQPANQWNQGGTNQQQTRQMDLSQYMSAGNPLGRGQQTQAAPPMAGQPQPPQFDQFLPFGGQNAGIPPFQFRATDFMGNQFSDPGAFTAQQGAMAQALNQQRAQGIGQGQFGSLNPQLAYQQGAEMLQGGWRNQFATPPVQDAAQNIRGLLHGREALLQPGTPGSQYTNPQDGSQWTWNAGGWLDPAQPSFDRPVLKRAPTPGGSVNQNASPGYAMPIADPYATGSVTGGAQQKPSGRQSNMNQFTKADAPPGQRFDNVAYEAKLRELRDDMAEKSRSGRPDQAARVKWSLDSLMEQRDYLRAQAEDNVTAANRALDDIARKRSAVNRQSAATTATPGDLPGDQIAGGFNYSAARREYEQRRRASVAANNRIPVAKRNATYGSDANRRAYEAWM